MSIFLPKNFGKIQLKIGTPKIDTPQIDAFFKFWALLKCVNLWRRTVSDIVQWGFWFNKHFMPHESCKNHMHFDLSRLNRRNYYKNIDLITLLMTYPKNIDQDLRFIVIHSTSFSTNNHDISSICYGHEIHSSMFQVTNWFPCIILISIN